MKYLGVDFGLRKVGLALSEGEIATPFLMVNVKNTDDAFNKLKDIIQKQDIDTVVVGLPESGIRQTVLKFIQKMQTIIKVKIAEETLSSKSAREEMIKLGLGRKKRIHEDAYAACVILQNYLDNL